MARTPRYIVDNKKKEVVAYMEGLNSKELKIVGNYSAIGYAIVPTDKVPNAKKLYTKENILKFLTDTKKDAEFNLLNLMKQKNEEGKKKGFVFALKEFRKKYDEEFIAWLEK